MEKAPLRIRLAKATLGSRTKEYIPSLSQFDTSWGDSAGRIRQYRSKNEQVAANVGWVFTANNAIVDPCAAVELKLYCRKEDGDREEIMPGEPAYEILELLNDPNAVFTGEQMRQLHFTYMNLTGEGYILMTG